MNDNFWVTLLKKISNQSTLIIGIMFLYTFFSLKDQSKFTTPLAISGGITFAVAIFLLIGNFFLIQFTEGYKYLIEELKGVIATLKSQHKFTEGHYQKMLTTTQSGKESTLERIGYTTESNTQITTEG